MKNNILAWYDRSTEYDRLTGLAWYDAARLECTEIAKQSGIELKRIVYAVAALSPQLKWERNIAVCKAVINGSSSFAGVYSANIEKAWHILWDTDNWERWLSGPKVTNFAANILGDTSAVTIDTWAWRIAEGDDLWAKPTSTTLSKRYDDLVDAYREAALSIGIAPHQLQAITWTTIRRIATGRTTPAQLSFNF